MHLWTKASLALLLAGTIASAVIAWHYATRPESACTPAPIAVVATAPTPAPAPKPAPPAKPAPAPKPDPDAESGATVVAGKLDLAWMPGGYVRDLPAAKTAELAKFVAGWTHDDTVPRIEYKRGVAFVHSAEDRGDDGPYPRSASPEAQRICGSPSVWLRARLQQSLAHQELVCDKNVCSYSGMEYAPAGFLVFREIEFYGEKTWALDAWVEVYEAALGEPIVKANYNDAVAGMRRIAAATCAGEPAGAY